MRRAWCIAALIGLGLAFPGTAEAKFLPGAELVSMSPERREQADARTVALDISADGRYVAFETLASNLFPIGYQDPPGGRRIGGIFRRDLVTGQLEIVAFGDLVGPTPTRLGARNPSISGDGRFVSFSTADQLVAADVNTQIDVYVRDMGEPLTSPTAFELVSARDGSEQGATYAPGVVGAQVTVDSGMSDDGRRVVFGTVARSDLPAEPSATTERGQLFVRDLDANTTTLVTRRKLDGAPAGGASSRTLASISGDGTTVVWPGTNADVQTRLQPNEAPSLVYYLWRRVADGPTAPTRRVTGFTDPDDPACPESEPIAFGDQTTIGPCYGPLAQAEGWNSQVNDRLPSLSTDGTRVAFQAEAFLRPTNLQGNQMDAFVTDMSPGLPRKAWTIELTRENQAAVPLNNIEPVKISGDGNRIAFTSTRRDFGLTTPRLISDPGATAIERLYVVHLDRMEIERVSFGHDGSDIDRRVLTGQGSVALSGDGRRVAFVSDATNLIPGDANEQPDAFVASADPGGGGASGTNEPPFGDVTPREDTDQSAGPALPVSLSRGPGGSVRVRVKAPEAGTLALTARARVRAGARTRLRPIAKARKRVRRAGMVTVVLKPERRYRRYLKREKRLRSRLEIRFSPKGSGRALVARRTVSFTS